MADDPAAPAPDHTILAFDYGARRIGIAVAVAATGRARPLATVAAEPEPARWTAIGTVIDEWKPDLLLVGIPYNSDGSDSAMTETARVFAAALQQRWPLPMVSVDEHLSSFEAADTLRERRRAGLRGRRVSKGDVDQVAAQIILDSWLNEMRRAP